MATVDDARVVVLRERVEQLLRDAEEAADLRQAAQLRQRAHAIDSTLQALGLADRDEDEPRPRLSQRGILKRDVQRRLRFAVSRVKPTDLLSTKAINQTFSQAPSVTLLTAEAWSGGFGLSYMIPYGDSSKRRVLRSTLLMRWRVLDNNGKEYKTDQRINMMADAWHGYLIGIPQIAPSAEWLRIVSPDTNSEARIDASLFRS